MQDEMPKYNDLIGDILKRHTDEGGMENLQGQGKPLSKDYLSGDTFAHFQKIAKDAGYKPHWLKLQHEIKDSLIEMRGRIGELTRDEIQETVRKLNEKIAEHNRHCPPPMLKGKVREDSIDEAIERWK